MSDRLLPAKARLTDWLGPLPEPDKHCFDDDVGRDVWSYSAAKMREYAMREISNELHRVADRLDEIARHRHSTARTCEASQALQYKTSADTLRIVADELRA